MLIALALLAFGALAALCGFVLARYAVLRACGARDLRLAAGLGTRWDHPDAPRFAPAAVVAAGIAGVYVVAAVFGATGALTTGEVHSDEQSMTVEVAPDGPAARAGVVSGDRIVSVDGAPVRSWDELRAAVRAHANDEVILGIARDGVERTIPVPLPKGRDARLKVGPPQVHHPVGVGAAIAAGLKLPFAVMTGTVKGFASMLFGHEKPDLAGPVAITRETSRATSSSVSGGFTLVAALISYCLWMVILFSFVTFPRRAHPTIRNGG